MIKLTFGIVAAVALAVLSGVSFFTMNPAEARTWEYCRTDVTNGGALICSFANMEQCLATVSGRGGLCLRDPFLPDARSAYAYQPGLSKRSGGTRRGRSEVR
jgi:hypothetical protein